MLGGYNFPIENVAFWIVVGFLSGTIIHLIDGREVKGGFWATAITGVLGGILGGLLSAVMFGLPSAGLNTAALILAILGGLVFAFIQRVITEPQNEYSMPKNGSNPVYYSQVYPYRAGEDASTRVNEPVNTKKSNPIEVERYLKGVDYPASKDTLLRNALQMGADEDIVYVLDQLPEKLYNSPIEVNEELGKTL